MFTALAIVCALEGEGSCFSVTNKNIFPTLEACEKDLYTAFVYAEANGFRLKRFECFNWGVST